MTAAPPPETPRRAATAAVLKAVTVLGRAVASGPHPPLGERVVTKSQMQTLFLLAHGAGPVTPGMVAEQLGITAGAVTQLVDGLKTEGLVESVRHPDDARSRVLKLTEGTAEQIARFESDTVDRLGSMFAGLTDDEVIQLASLLRRATEENNDE